MITADSHLPGRTRLRFPNLYEKESFIKNAKELKGLQKLESRENSKRLTALVEYEPDSPFGYFINSILSKEPEENISINDASSYISPLIKHPVTKALWLMFVYGFPAGLVQYSVTTRIINPWLRSKFQ